MLVWLPPACLVVPPLLIHAVIRYEERGTRACPARLPHMITEWTWALRVWEGLGGSFLLSGRYDAKPGLKGLVLSRAGFDPSPEGTVLCRALTHFKCNALLRNPHVRNWHVTRYSAWFGRKIDERTSRSFILDVPHICILYFLCSFSLERCALQFQSQVRFYAVSGSSSKLINYSAALRVNCVCAADLLF